LYYFTSSLSRDLDTLAKLFFTFGANLAPPRRRSMFTQRLTAQPSAQRAHDEDWMLNDLPIWCTNGKFALLGEGNFTFAEAVSRRLGSFADEMIATTIDSRVDVLTQYWGDTTTLPNCESRGVELRFNVDATSSSDICQLSHDADVDLFIWNFPSFSREWGNCGRPAQNKDMIRSLFNNVDFAAAQKSRPIRIWLTLYERQWDKWSLLPCLLQANGIMLDQKLFYEDAERSRLPGYEPNFKCSKNKVKFTYVLEFDGKPKQHTEVNVPSDVMS
jgi:hypothetical protein